MTANRVRFETRPSDGRERIRHHDGEAERYVYVHRLALFAWSPGLSLEDLWADPDGRHPRLDKVHAHHDAEIGWLNAEWNLAWEEPGDHGRVESGRRERGPDGAFVRPRASGAPAAEAADTD